MIQYFRFPDTIQTGIEYPVISGNEPVKFFLKRFMYLIIFIYSTFFLAVALPFVKTPFYPVYFFGSLATTMLFLRLMNHIVKYLRFRGGKIRLSPDGVELTDAVRSVRIPLSAITFFELNPLGSLVIREKGHASSFPVYLLAENDRKELLSLLHDMNPKRTEKLKKIWEMIDAVVVALVLAVHIIQFIVQAYYIPTGSMKDTLLVGDHLFVEKISYGPVIPQMAFMESPIRLNFLAVKKLDRGDIVIFRPPHDEDKDYIKRCIALPGDDFRIRDGAVWINGKKQKEPYTRTETSYEQFLIGEKENIEGVVPKGKVIVMGDNRNNSQDSRYFGFLDIERIKGRAFILYWNTDQIKRLDFSRFGLIR